MPHPEDVRAFNERFGEKLGAIPMTSPFRALFPPKEETITTSEVYQMLKEIRDSLQVMRGQTDSGLVIGFNGMTQDERSIVNAHQRNGGSE